MRLGLDDRTEFPTQDGVGDRVPSLCLTDDTIYAKF